MRADEQLLHPPVSPHIGWWLLALGAALAAVALLVLARALRRRKVLDEPGFTVAHLRRETVAGIDAAVWAHAAGGLTGQEAALRLGRLVREFVGQTSDDEADFMTANQLQEAAAADPRLAAAARFTVDVQRAGFRAAEDVDVTALAAEARKVVTEWL